jgi:hypothetical protein
LHQYDINSALQDGALFHFCSVIFIEKIDNEKLFDIQSGGICGFSCAGYAYGWGS